MSKVASLWPAWVALTLAVTAKPLLWHLEYFRSPGPRFLSFYLAALAVLGAVAVFYLRRRESRPAWIAAEPRAFFGLLVVFFLTYAPLPTLYALWILFVCFSLGRMALGRLTEGALEALTLWPAAGLGLLSALLFAMGMAGLYYRWLALGLLALAAALCWRNAQRLWDLLRRVEAGYAARAGGPLWGLCLVFVVVFSLSSAMVVLSPEIAFDPVSFHFVLARDYATGHRLAVVPHLPYSYFPQNVEMLYALGFLLEGQATAKILTYAFFPLAAMTLALIGRRWFSPTGALVGAALFLTTPFIAWTGSVAKNDMALALYLLLALYCVMRWIEDRGFVWLAAAALFLGFSFGVKHVAILGAVPVAALALWHWRRARLGFRQALTVAAIFACSGLFWHARTWVLTGHPLYPEFFTSAVDSTTAKGHPELTWLDRGWILLSVPWSVHFRGLHAFESPSPNPVGFALVAFLPLLFRRGGARNRAATLLLLFCAGYFLYFAAILIKVRYAMAAFGVLFVLLGDRLGDFYASGGAVRRGSILALAAYCFVFSLSLTLILEMNRPRIELFARRISREQFLRQSLLTYRSIEALNKVARPGERAYSVGNCSTFYANIEFRCYFDDADNYTVEQVGRDLRAHNFQYLIVSNAWAEPKHMHVVEHLYHPVLLHQDESFRLYRVYRFG